MDITNDETLVKFIGKGMVFPIELTNGRANLETGSELIQSSIKNIFAYTYGDRFFLHEFGALLEGLLEEPNDQVLQKTIQHYVVDAIFKWEKRVEPVSTFITKVNDRKVNISLTYRIRNSKLVDTFVFPYYPKLIY